MGTQGNRPSEKAWVLKDKVYGREGVCLTQCGLTPSRVFRAAGVLPPGAARLASVRVCECAHVFSGSLCVWNPSS